jgi:hypothetical protein
MWGSRSGLPRPTCWHKATAAGKSAGSPARSSGSASSLIRYSRGTLEILDRGALTDAACVCYSIVQAEYEKLLGAPTA